MGVDRKTLTGEDRWRNESRRGGRRDVGRPLNPPLATPPKLLLPATQSGVTAAVGSLAGDFVGRKNVALQFQSPTSSPLGLLPGEQLTLNNSSFRRSLSSNHLEAGIRNDAGAARETITPTHPGIGTRFCCNKFRCIFSSSFSYCSSDKMSVFPSR